MPTSTSSELEASVLKEYRRLVQDFKLDDLHIGQPNGHIRDILDTLLRHIPAPEVRLQAEQLVYPEEL